MKRILMPAIVAAALFAGVANGKEYKSVNFPGQAQVEGIPLPNPEIKAGLLGGARG